MTLPVLPHLPIQNVDVGSMAQERAHDINVSSPTRTVKGRVLRLGINPIDVHALVEVPQHQAERVLLTVVEEGVIELLVVITNAQTHGLTLLLLDQCVVILCIDFLRGRCGNWLSLHRLNLIAVQSAFVGQFITPVAEGQRVSPHVKTRLLHQLLAHVLWKEQSIREIVPSKGILCVVLRISQQCNPLQNSNRYLRDVDYSKTSPEYTAPFVTP